MSKVLKTAEWLNELFISNPELFDVNSEVIGANGHIDEMLLLNEDDVVEDPIEERRYGHGRRNYE